MLPWETSLQLVTDRLPLSLASTPVASGTFRAWLTTVVPASSWPVGVTVITTSAVEVRCVGSSIVYGMCTMPEKPFLGVKVTLPVVRSTDAVPSAAGGWGVALTLRGAGPSSLPTRLVTVFATPAGVLAGSSIATGLIVMFTFPVYVAPEESLAVYVKL